MRNFFWPREEIDMARATRGTDSIGDPLPLEG